jgi:hypothetical protein
MDDADWVALWSAVVGLVVYLLLVLGVLYCLFLPFWAGGPS